MVDQRTEGHAIIPRGGEVCNLNSLQEEDTNMNNWVNIKTKSKHTHFLVQKLYLECGQQFVV